MVQEKLGPFTIGRVLGRGGMGAVYEGMSELDDSIVALKILADFLDTEEDAEVRLRFESEIETLKRLHHPNIVRLLGFGEEQGQLYYVMEFVNGSSLQQELRKKRLFQWYEAAKIGLDICQALRHAHDRGIIHRDIKPANILLDQEGNTKLSDFGIARFFGSQQITDVHSIIGTLEYMSPEQALGQPVNSSADIYSLGCVLYTLLASKPPYTARSLPEILRSYKSTSPVSVRSLRHDVPENLEYLIMDLLHIRPEDRPRNVLLVAKRLQSLIQALVGNAETIKVFPMVPETPRQQPSILSLSEGDFHPDSYVQQAEAQENVVLLENDESKWAPQNRNHADPFPKMDDEDLSTPLFPDLLSSKEIDKRLVDTISATSEEKNVMSSSVALQHGKVFLNNTQTLRNSKDDPLADVAYWSESLRTPPNEQAANEKAQEISKTLHAKEQEDIVETPSKISAKNPNATTRFVAVKENNLDPFEDDHRVNRPILSVPIAVTSTLLMIIGLTVYYLLQPASPEVLFKRITTTIKEDEASGEYSPTLLRTAQKDIEGFLSLYSNHPSAEQVRLYQDELDLLEHERRLERRTQILGIQSLSPVERVYVEVLTSSPNDAERMITRLRAFINVFQTGDPTSPEPVRRHRLASNPVEICVELAKRRLKKLEQTIEEINAEQEQVVQRRLEEAVKWDFIYPSYADGIRRGIIELYQDHSWAKKVVEEAKQQLQE